MVKLEKIVLVVVLFSTCICWSQSDLKKENKSSKKEAFQIPLPDTYPIYRGCEDSSNPEVIKFCTINKIREFIVLSFDIEMADKVLPQAKSTKFLVEFVIDKKGKIKDINAKANKREIAVEAIQILRRLPKLKTPGLKDSKPVDTPFRVLVTVYF